MPQTFMQRKNLRQARMKRGWSQEELAARVPVRQETVSAWECGAAKPREKNRQKLCEIFGVSDYDDLLRLFE